MGYGDNRDRLEQALEAVGVHADVGLQFIDLTFPNGLTFQVRSYPNDEWGSTLEVE